MLHRVSVEPAACLAMLYKRLGKGQPGGAGYLFGGCPADVSASVQCRHCPLGHSRRLRDLAASALWQLFQQGRNRGIGAIFPHTLLFEVGIKGHQVRGLDLAHLKLPQPGRNARHKPPIVVHGFGLEFLFSVLGEPTLYQVVHLHGRIQRNAAAHFLFKGICLTLQFLFQLLPGQARRGCIGAIDQHLTA